MPEVSLPYIPTVIALERSVQCLLSKGSVQHLGGGNRMEKKGREDTRYC